VQKDLVSLADDAFAGYWIHCYGKLWRICCVPFGRLVATSRLKHYTKGYIRPFGRATRVNQLLESELVKVTRQEDAELLGREEVDFSCPHSAILRLILLILSLTIGFKHLTRSFPSDGFRHKPSS